jgi:hypothetical protein
MAFRLSNAGPSPKLKPMQPSPNAETSNPLFPNTRFFIIHLLNCSKIGLAGDIPRQITPQTIPDKGRQKQKPRISGVLNSIQADISTYFYYSYCRC